MDASLIFLPIASIDEDPNQPRTVFDEESLRELAETIRLRGVKTPISVRPHPDVPGRYIINHGARRLRASLLAGKETVPACVDADYTEEDQLIENVQRNNLSPREVAEFIGKLLARGKRKSEIAQAIGKSPAYVTQHAVLLDLPAPLDAVFNDGRCTDVTVINELVKLFRRNPEQTTTWLQDKTQDLNRGTVKLFKDFLEVAPELKQDAPAEATPSRKVLKTNPATLLHPVLWVTIEGRRARLLLHRVHPVEGMAWFQDEGTEVFEASLSSAQMVKLEEDSNRHNTNRHSR